MDKDFEKRLNNLEKIYENATNNQVLVIHTLTFINKAWEECIKTKNLKKVSNDAFFTAVAALVVKEREKCFNSDKKIKKVEMPFNEFLKIKSVAITIIKEICRQNNYKGDYLDFREPIFVDPTMLEGTNEI